MTPSDFNALLLSTAQSVLPWIAAGVVGGVVVLAVVFGIRKGLDAVYYVAHGESRNHDGVEYDDPDDFDIDDALGQAQSERDYADDAFRESGQSAADFEHMSDEYYGW